MSSTRYLTLPEILFIHREVVDQAGGTTRIRDMGALKSSLAQIKQTHAGEELYPDLEEKAAALCFFIVRNHI
jgi:death-on-curing protein